MIRVPIVFRGPNGAAAGVAAQHSQVLYFTTSSTISSTSICSSYNCNKKKNNSC